MTASAACGRPVQHAETRNQQLQAWLDRTTLVAIPGPPTTAAGDSQVFGEISRTLTPPAAPATKKPLT
ncbi:hypothetical protein [Saccharothrix sp. ALI-22-I]|uniref:hypothetical protein n=1 Tax=Saccharothrix sp. ALI-22-I TaxID=1933778 RepID=UPI0015C39CCA|nr:hypothetical protein [Saccharothrix sp. ALI-22-I]